MCDVFICSDSGVGLCEDDRKILEGLGADRQISFSKSFGESKSSTERFGSGDITENWCDDKNSASDKDVCKSIALDGALATNAFISEVKVASDKSNMKVKEENDTEEKDEKESDINNNNVKEGTNKESMEKQNGCAGEIKQQRSL